MPSRGRTDVVGYVASSLASEYEIDSAAFVAGAAEPDWRCCGIAGIVTLTYNADGQRTAKQSTDASVMGFLYDYKKLLHETDDIGGEITNTYATTSDGE